MNAMPPFDKFNAFWAELEGSMYGALGALAADKQKDAPKLVAQLRLMMLTSYMTGFIDGAEHLDRQLKSGTKDCIAAVYKLSQVSAESAAASVAVIEQAARNG